MPTAVATAPPKIKASLLFAENTNNLQITKDNDPNGTPVLAFEGKKGAWVKVSANFMYRGGGVYYGLQSLNATPLSFSSGIVQSASGWQACSMSQYFQLTSTGKTQFQMVFKYSDLPGQGQVNNFLLSRESARAPRKS